ncbi:MAG: PilX N-terminal domain-containing pilus assembly protein [Candidatus Sulfotelmatobacter sp.]|jgi:type II secretory pathway pseudopilin PulG
MGKSTRDSRGFTLIAALLLTVLLSGLAIGLIFLVTGQQKMGNNDLEGNLAFYGAESGIENLTAQLSALYQSSQSPTSASITALTSPANWPTAITGSNIQNMNYVENITWPTVQPNGTPCPNPLGQVPPPPCGTWNVVGSGPDQGMVASLIPYNVSVTATRIAGSGETTDNGAVPVTGASVNLTRTVQVALLPAFEFGVFCNGDCDYFAGPNFNFGGRVHANGNLFLASGANLTFTDKVAAVGQIIVDQLENGWPTSNQYGGSVWIPNASLGCPAAPATGPGGTGNCIQLTQGSWTGGFPQTGTANPAWKGISTNTFNSFAINGLTGATTLNLPFVQASNVGPIEIIRRPTPGDSQLLASSRLYNKATIRILLADTLADLHPDRGAGSLDVNDVQLTGSMATTPGTMYFGVASTAASPNWVPPTNCGAPGTWPIHGEVTAAAVCQSVWLRVEYYNGGAWVGVTQEWLGHGFGRSYDNPPTHPYSTNLAAAPLCPTAAYPSWPTVTASDPLAQCQNPISPAILILQQLQNGLGLANATGAASVSKWLPINLYDAREGEPRDSRPAGDPETSCSPIGVMNVVELDVGNLWLWLQGVGAYAGGSGPLVSITDQYGANENGYLLYFSDHRGMLPDAHPLATFYNNISGMSGLNDTVNRNSQTGVPDGVLEPLAYYPYSPEDTAEKENGILDKWGEPNLGAGFGITAANMAQPYYISGTFAGIAACSTKAEWNMVTAARHALRLVDGGMDNAGNSYLPPTNGNAGANGVGFTVASEEPVYVYGNYNTGTSDPFWPSENVINTPHSAAAIIADAVTLLSNPPSGAALPLPNPASNPIPGWNDHESFLYPGQATYVNAAMPGRQGNNSYYRVAIAAGKSIPFPETAYSIAIPWKDFGTDGGMHNFLRYLEDRSDNGNGGTVNYAGSLISMYYSQYATGIFKCCNSVYGAPNRNYFFDTQFQNPNFLPPGTPMFQDVVALSSHQNFTPQ